jgi:hypothetical protein
MHSSQIVALGAVDFGIVIEGVVVITASGLRRRDAKPKGPLQKTVFSIEGNSRHGRKLDQGGSVGLRGPGCRNSGD